MAVDKEETTKEMLRAQNDAINTLRETILRQKMSANRSLQLINAGGAVALLAFLGQTWNVAPEIRMAVVIATALMVVGLCLAVWSGFLLPTYSEWGFRQNEATSAATKYNRICRRYFSITGLSFLAFVSAVSYVLVSVTVVNFWVSIAN